MSTLLVHPPGARLRRFFVGLIVAIIAVNLLTFFPADNGLSARLTAVRDGKTNDIFARAVEEQPREKGRFGLSVWLSQFAAGSAIYRGPTDDVVGREASQNLLGVGRAADVIELPSFSNEWLKGVDYDALIVADAEPYKRSGTAPLTTGQPWAIALDPAGEHAKFALFQAPLRRFDGVMGVLLVETSLLPNFPHDVTSDEVGNAG